jgi:hypothetical protein
MKPLCEICGDRHESYQAHRFATNTVATNRTATNKDGDGSGHQGNDEGVLRAVGSAAEGRGAATDGLRDAGLRTANRRSKEAYNAYQREYMRKRRAVPS